MNTIINWLFTALPNGATRLQAIVIMAILIAVLYNLFKICAEFFDYAGEDDE